MLKHSPQIEIIYSWLRKKPSYLLYVSRVHALGNLKRSKQHPDARAIFYEEKTYSKRKVLDFASVLNGFTAALKLVDLFSDVDSKLLKRIMQFHPDGKYPDYRDTLKFFKVSLIHVYSCVFMAKWWCKCHGSPEVKERKHI